MHQLRKFLLGTVVSLLISLGISHAGSMSLSPSTGTFGMHCVYPVSFSVNVGGIESKAVDMRVIYNTANMQFTGASAPQLAYGTSLVRTGTTTIAIDLGWANYGIGSKYWLFNRTDLVTPLTGVGDQLYYTRYFQTITNTLTGHLDFYYSGGWNGDDSNIQSGITNNFVDVLDTINSGYYNFVARPCILDVDPALFTGYASGVTQSYLSGLAFTIYDFTGNSTSGYDSTYHYYWNGTVGVDYNDYIPVGANDIDNQYGVNSGTIIISLSGLSLEADAFTGEVGGYFSGGTLVYTSFTLASLGANGLFTCSPMSTSVDMGNTLTWNRNDRGYDCLLNSTGLVGLSGIALDANQTLQVTITGADNQNYNGTINTGSITFPITINGIDNTPPYILLSTYRWTGALNGFNTTGAGPLFSPANITNREYWTKDDIEIHLTGSETIIMTNVIGYSGTDLNVYVSGGNGFSGINQTLILTGNMSGFVTFQDIPTIGMDPNYGQTYATGGTRYTHDFNIDVFWIDRITTEITGSLAYTGDNGQLHHATLTLTGFATGNADSIKDDEFYVYQYSGVDGASNTPDVTYVTGYSNTGYSLYHSGIVFNDNWTGYVYYRDRANNTGQMYVNVTGISTAAIYTIIAVPQDRVTQVGGNSGTIARFVFVTGFFFDPGDPSTWSGNMVFSGLMKTSSTGTYTFNYGFPASSDYTLIVEGQSNLSMFITGLTINGPRIFTGFSLIPGDMLLFSPPGAQYISTASYKDGGINPGDVAAMVSWIEKPGGYEIYTGRVMPVWTGETKIYSPQNAPYYQYYPGDLNGDGGADSSDINMIISRLNTQVGPPARHSAGFFDDFN